MGSIVGIALRGFGKALKKDPTKPLQVKPETKITGKKPKLQKTVKPPKARMEYTIDVKDQEGKLIKKKEQVIGEKKRK
jgi:hypothetical protein|tara:strand:- start:1415 stop:1648 length:234 start_codon:yes stop_codon:yes gene_type:complete